MSALAKRITITLLILATPFILGLLITYQVIPIEWVSFMEIQPSFRPMEAPLDLPSKSVPIEGAAYIPGAGSPTNPVMVDSSSLERGAVLYDLNCKLCHGDQGKGDGPIAKQLIRKPVDLTGADTSYLSDGEVFMLITNGVLPPVGVNGGMPALKENLSIRERWDVVNFVRSLQAK